MVPMTRSAWSLLAVGAVLLTALGCRSAPALGKEQGLGAARAPVKALMDACWSAPGASGVVVLTLMSEGGLLRDVLFATREGASNADARCLRAVAFAYPWEKGSVPPTLELRAPARAPSGWEVLEHLRLLTEGAFPVPRGLVDSAPLVSACLKQGGGLRPGLQFVLETTPVKVGLRIGQDEVKPLSDTERCIGAVLGSTLYPGTRTFTLAFPPTAVPPTEPKRVAWYFEPAGATPALDTLSPMAVKEAVALLQPQIASCWEAAIERRAGLSGGRTWRFVADSSGSFEQIQVVGNQSDARDEASDYLLDQCLAKALARGHLRGGGPRAAGTYSWVFAQR